MDLASDARESGIVRTKTEAFVFTFVVSQVSSNKIIARTHVCLSSSLRDSNLSFQARNSYEDSATN
jgi:hypothetical protein